ncbi:hypothetical protein [Mycobacterium shigaense]|uniref:hypothetical protein n=1 Tax=Mycobacterium shigaense TaxID=722731 RepID=UPI000E585FDE|nr:hypothetical protein [Mycobacterium shigaense]
MVERLDVAERLAEGRVAVEHTQAYVRACHALGYQQPDLTSSPSQVRDQFDSEDALDLRVLDRDCAQLRAAGDAVAEGLRIQRAQAGELAAGWTGPAGEAAGRFLQRHCDAANMVVTEVRAAAQRCESLRDNLWFLLDSKVSSAIAIDDRSQSQRADWLAAAAVVTSGAGERSTAEQVIGQQVMPYVDNDIRTDWLDAMRSSLAGFATAYDMVIDRMAAAPAACFESPGNLGPEPPQPSTPSAAEVPVPAPAPIVASLPADPVAAQPAPIAAPVAGPAAPMADAAPVLPTTVPDLGSALGDAAVPAGAGGLGGLGDMGVGSGGPGGLGGLAGRIVDAISALLDPAADQSSDPATLDDALDDSDDDKGDALDDSDDNKSDDKSDDDAFHPVAEEDDAADGEGDEAAKPEDAQQVRPVDGPAAAPPLPVEESPPAEAPVPAGTPAGEPSPPEHGPNPTEGATPCEIAADQLPQAGQ